MKNIFLYSLIIVSTAFFSNSVVGQQVEISERININTGPMLPAETGTYQIHNSAEKGEVALSHHHLVYISESRHQTQEKILYLGYYTSIRVLPYSVINDPNFVPLTE